MDRTNRRVQNQADGQVGGMVRTLEPVLSSTSLELTQPGVVAV